jgi:ribosomal protein L13
MQPDNITGTAREKIWSKRTFLFVVFIPLIIAALGPLSPKLYEEITKPRASLSYRVLSGPAIGESGRFQQIFSIGVVNSGKVPLTGVRAQIQTRSGQIEKLVVDQNDTGSHPTITSAPTAYEISIERMLPTDGLNLSAMTSSSQADPGIQINVRSNEVRGTRQEGETPTDTSSPSVIGGAAGIALALLASVLGYLFGLRRVNDVRQIQTPEDFIGSIGSRRHITVQVADLNLTQAFPRVTEATRWQSVFDGKELCIVNVTDLNIEGLQSKLLAEPGYAWVLNFRNCHNIALRNLSIGHLVPGSCRGGVLRFESCTGISIAACELFGCGTYGLEFNGCERVEILGTITRSCTYGIMQVTNCKNVVFSGCKFTDNREFDLCQFFGTIDHLLFKNCIFEQNMSGDGYSFFNLEGLTERSTIFVQDSTFTDNHCSSLSNDKYGFLAEQRNAYVRNRWEASRNINV